jgi:hypothetical protein
MLESDFSFRSGRNYLQSASVFDFIQNHLDYESRDIDFEFAKRTESNCAFLSEAPADPEAVIGRYSDQQTRYFIVENANVITRMEEYDDVPVREASQFIERTVTVPGDLAGFSPIEKMIAAYKYLLQSLPGNEQKKFVFARVRLSRIPQGDFTITFKRLVSGHFYQGMIRDGEENLGFILYGEWL